MPKSPLFYYATLSKLTNLYYNNSFFTMIIKYTIIHNHCVILPKGVIFLHHFLLFSGQLFLLWMIYYLSTWGVEFFHLPIPGSVLGMLLLFFLLCTGIIKEKWVIRAAEPLLKHLAFFFIPIAVGLMEWGELFAQKGHLLFLPLVISTLVALLATGGIAQILDKPKRKKGSDTLV